LILLLLLLLLLSSSLLLLLVVVVVVVAVLLLLLYGLEPILCKIASAVQIYKAAISLLRFEKNSFSSTFKKRSSQVCSVLAL
jgi:hypothetical protein